MYNCNEPYLKYFLKNAPRWNSIFLDLDFDKACKANSPHNGDQVQIMIALVIVIIMFLTI